MRTRPGSGNALVVVAFLMGIVAVCAARAQTPEGGPNSLTQPEARAALVGKTWQLVEIQSMDDQTVVPDERSKYTFTLVADGSFRVLADCNRGTGSWSSVHPGKLEFGPIAATNALCPPGSIHDRFMAQFPWVRSYVMKDGHLFLATMADGSIVEFEPQLLPVAAVVLGESVRTDDAKVMQEVVIGRLLDRYVDEHGIVVTETELDAYLEAMRRGMRASGLTEEEDMSPEEVAEVERMRREMGRAMIRRWKLNKALYSDHGGRIIFQQLGPEPLDAYRRFLEAHEAAGDFEILAPSMHEAFWRYFRDDSMHTFYEPGSEAEAQAFSVPPWERAKAE